MIARRKYCQVFYVLGEVYKLLRSRSDCNKRELYYKNVEIFFGSYRQLCSSVAHVCGLLNSSPWELGVLATSKSLIAGPLKIGNSDGEWIDFADPMMGMPLPNDFHRYDLLRTTAKFVLLVEKETVFKRLISDDIFSRIGYECLLVTGRGQGDFLVRMCLNRIANECCVPIFGLFDADPYGIEILLTYKCGSRVRLSLLLLLTFIFTTNGNL